MPKPLSESIRLSEAATSSDARSGVLEVEFLTPGWGSSGYYSPEVVEASAPLFKVGTHLYLDHPTDTEEAERPIRSVKDIAAIVTEAGSVNKDTGGVRGKVKATAPYRDLLTDETLMESIGLSIRGSASDITVGEAEGRKGPIVEGLVDIASVDFVTRAGRGGRVLSVLESARPSQVIERAIAHGVQEATADERRQQLSDAVRTAYAGNDRYAWVQDFDETTVWFQASGESERSRMWEQSYTVADDDMSVSLTGARLEVRAITKYVPAARPDSTTTSTEESEEDTMAEIKIEESQHKALLEKAGRVDTVESENTALKTENTQLKEAAAARDRSDRARGIVTERAREADVEFTPREVKGFLADIKVKEDGSLDEEAFTKLVDEDAAAKKAAGGAGSVTGFGGTTAGGSGEVSESDFDAIFDTKVKEA